MNMVEMKNITKRFDDRLVLDNISLEIHQGDIFGLIGPNGAGKSTLINILTGLLKAEGGTVTIDGLDLTADPIGCKQKLGLVPQSLAIEKEATAYDNLEYFGAFYGLGGRLLKERVKEALEVTGLSDRAGERVKKFSGGMMRRLNMGAAILHHPELLILDEPTVGVDAQSRNHTFDYLRRINREFGTTILYTSHYMEEVEMLCNRIFILDVGREIAYGTKKDIMDLHDQTSTIKVSFLDQDIDRTEYLGQLEGVHQFMAAEGSYSLIVDRDFELEPFILKLHREGHSIRSISVEEPKLEEIFLSLTGKTLRD